LVIPRSIFEGVIEEKDQDEHIQFLKELRIKNATRGKLGGYDLPDLTVPLVKSASFACSWERD
jgi:hypothetical protein